MARLVLRRQPALGFTLVELVMVILLLGIMATFSSQFIGIGTRLYGDASRREQLMSDARFAMERLNREVRDAVPGSVRIERMDGSLTAPGPCLRFWPISSASRYFAINQPVAGSTTSLALVMATPPSAADPTQPDERAVKANDWLAIFPLPRTDPNITLDQGCDTGRCTAQVSAAMVPAISGAQTIQYRVDASQGTLGDLSLAKRVFFAREQVRYCVEGSSLIRATAAIGPQLPGNGVLMAGSIGSGDFYSEPSAFKSGAEFGVNLRFERQGETVLFNHKIEVLNAP